MLLYRFLHQVYMLTHFDLRQSTIQQLEVTISIFGDYLKMPPRVEHLTDHHLLKFFKWMKQERDSSPVTINSKRRMLITLWKEAHRMKLVATIAPDSVRVPRARVPQRNPTAWKEHEFQRLISAAEFMPKKRSWTSRDWRALLSVVYDTGERIRAVLATNKSCLDLEFLKLTVTAEARKGGIDKVHDLHPETASLLEYVMEKSGDLLFDFPFAERQIWTDFNELLKLAKLPVHRRNKFHRVRRTGFSHVYLHAGPQAASEYAGHRTDMTSYYLDRTLLPAGDAIRVLPRPWLKGNNGGPVITDTED